MKQKGRCEYCGEDFLMSEWQAKRLQKGYKVYCSQVCINNKQKVHWIGECAICNAVISIPNFVQIEKIRKGEKIYCSIQCAGVDKRNRAHRNCVLCGKDFTASPAKIKEGGRIYCSVECYRNSLPKKVEMFCLCCGTKFFKHPSLVEKGWGIYCSSKCRYKDAPRRNKGRKSSMWNFTTFRGLGWSQQSYRVIRRDNFTCQDCGKKESECDRHFHVHHIIPFLNFSSQRKANSMKNLICLCPTCHRKAEIRVHGRQKVFLGKF